MGIGRFSLTPILPLMQQDAHLTLTVGGWLATGNYIGYLARRAGLHRADAAPRARRSAGASSVSASPRSLMGFSEWAPLWLALRFLAGVASAFVLVGTSAWAMPILAPSRQGGLVGACLLRRRHRDRLCRAVRPCRRHRCLELARRPGSCSASSRSRSRRCCGGRSAPRPRRTAQAREQGVRALPRPAIIAAACYAAFGFGYIIPGDVPAGAGQGLYRRPRDVRPDLAGVRRGCRALHLRQRAARPRPCAAGNYGRGRSGCWPPACSRRRSGSTCRRCCCRRCVSAAPS